MPAPIPLAELQEVGKKIHPIKGYLPSAYARYVPWKDIKEPQAVQYTSPEAMHEYNLTAIRSYARVLGRHGAIPQDAADEIAEKLNRENVSFLSADEWEDILRHDIRGLVTACKDKLSDNARHWLYIGLTSYDVINTAQSAALRDVTYELIVPDGLALADVFIKRAREEANTVVSGRTHRQQAVATTVGHWMGEVLDGYVPALMQTLYASDNLKGKVSGFVGTRAATNFLFRRNVHPRTLERETLDLMYLKPARMSSQVVNQYWYAQYFAPLLFLYGSLAKFANDVRSYQQTEVGEIFEARLSERVGSSTGAAKRNPITSENIGAHWRQLKPKFQSILDDFITDFQRDLQDSANKRYYVNEVPQIVLHGVRSAKGVAERMTIRRERALQNLGITEGLIISEPLQLALQVYCAERGMDVDTHDHVRLLADRAIEQGEPFIDFMQQDTLVQGMLPTLTRRRRDMLLKPETYLGAIREDIRLSTGEWERELRKLKDRVEEHQEKVHYI